MTIDDYIGRLEESVSIDAVPADVFAVLTAIEPVFEACAGLTVRTSEEGVTVADGGPDASPSVFGGQVRVTEREEPTNLTMVFDGATESTVAWTLQPEETSTLVTAIVTNSLCVPDCDGSTGGGRAQTTGGESSASELSPTALLDDILETLQTLCEQQPPPISMVSGALPEIITPSTAAISPYLDEVEAHTRDWTQQMGLFQAGEYPPWFREVPRFTCRIYPYASFADLCLCNDWLSWGLVYDDRVDDTEMGRQPNAMEAFQQPLVAVFADADAEQSDEPLVQGLADIWRRATERTSTAWQDRFAQHHADFFAAQQWEAHNRARGRVPDQDTYITKRRDTAATAIPFALGELVGGIDLPGSVYNDDTLTALRTTAANVFAWANDFYSLRQELAHPEGNDLQQEVHNLVVVVRHEQHCSLQEAITTVGAMLNEEIHRFEEQSQQLPASTGGDVLPSVYQTVLEQIVHGRLTWCQETVRYEAESS